VFDLTKQDVEMWWGRSGLVSGRGEGRGRGRVIVCRAALEREVGLWVFGSFQVFSTPRFELDVQHFLL
jgi:hypothetical protein